MITVRELPGHVLCRHGGASQHAAAITVAERVGASGTKSAGVKRAIEVFSHAGDHNPTDLDFSATA